MRGKKRARENVERYCFGEYDAKKLPSGEYELQVTYSSNDDLDKRMYELLRDISNQADNHNFFSKPDARMDGTDRYW